MAADADAELLAAAGGASAELVADGAHRRFALALDLRAFEAGPRLPLNLANVVLTLELPPELAGACGCWRVGVGSCFHRVIPRLLARLHAPPPPHAPRPCSHAGLFQASRGRVPPRLAPLRTQAVAVARGSQAAVPGGQASCEFDAGLMSVAALLARCAGIAPWPHLHRHPLVRRCAHPLHSPAPRPLALQGPGDAAGCAPPGALGPV